MQLNEVACSANVNNLVDRTAALRNHLNNTARTQQTVHLEEKFVQLSQKYSTATDAVRAQILQNVERGIESLDKEQHNIETIQDPRSMRVRRTYGRGGKRLRTGGEMADYFLRDLQKQAEREQLQKKASHDQIASTQPEEASSQTQPLFMTFDLSGTIVERSQSFQIINQRKRGAVNDGMPREKRPRLDSNQPDERI